MAKRGLNAIFVSGAPSQVSTPFTDNKPERMLLLENDDASVDLTVFRKAIGKQGVSIAVSGKSNREIKPAVLGALRRLWD